MVHLTLENNWAYSSLFEKGNASDYMVTLSLFLCHMKHTVTLKFISCSLKQPTVGLLVRNTQAFSSKWLLDVWKGFLFVLRVSEGRLAVAMETLNVLTGESPSVKMTGRAECVSGCVCKHVWKMHFGLGDIHHYYAPFSYWWGNIYIYCFPCI